MIRNTYAANAGVDADMERNRLLRLSGNFVDCGADGRINHRKDVAGNRVGEVLFVEWAKKKDGLANPGVAESEGFMELNDGEAENLGLRFEKLRDVGDAHSVAVVFDDGEDGPAGNAAGDFGHVVAKIFAMDFDPGVEGGVRCGRSNRRLSGSECRHGVQNSRQSETGFEKGSA